MGLQIVDRIADSTVKISNSRNGGSETWQSGVGSIRSGPLLTILWGSTVVEIPFGYLIAFVFIKRDNGLCGRLRVRSVDCG